MKDMWAKRRDIAKNIDKIEISERTRKILEFRFGGLTKSYTLEETGKRFKISKQRVKQIEEGVLKKLNLN